MPNTGRGGGISRKIANPADRARLKAIAREIEVPEGMGLIIRTAGQQRSKLEIRRDYEYSLRLWNDIRELTLRSVAPCTIHEEGALVKRAIRDLYSRDVDEVWVEGEEGYRTAKKVMSMLMPSRTRRVKLYKDELPLFHRHGVEEQLDSLHQPVIHLKSGASIVIHTTEALTAIDVNSGRSTRERNIEETALKTNLEAAEEIARQLRLRDIAGLVVIDFIDMGEMRNQRAVERRLREHLKTDRARVQLGRISAFGLLELSRQRLRPSFQELSTQLCPTCGGSGAIRSVESAALQALRVIELEGIKGKTAALAVTLPLPVALYMLNQKRERLIALEQRYGMSLDIGVDEELIAGAYEVETTAAKLESEVPEARAEARPEALAGDGAAVPAAAEAAEDDSEAGRKRRRRRRRRRRPGDGDSDAETMVPAEASAARAESAPPAEAPASAPIVPSAPAAAEAAPSGPSAEAAEPAPAAVGKEERKARRPRRRGVAKRSESREPAEPTAANGPMPSENGADRAGAPESEWPAAPAEAAPAPQPEAPRPEAEERAGASATAPAGTSREVRPAQPERAHERLEQTEANVPAAAVVDLERPAAPRRGWWNRFVRKDE
jgi:ribonuclease E